MREEQLLDVELRNDGPWKEPGRSTRQNTAEVMELERFAIHDGPGIRTVVFLQGCPLRCAWCANPESQITGRHLMYDQKRCVGCGCCAAVCPVSAITLDGKRPQFHRADCTGCGECGRKCLQNAIRYSGKTMTVDEIMAVIMRDRDYYDSSGGGVTFSGGDPFVQFPVFLEMLRRCREYGLHTAVETCGQTSLEKIERVIPLVDLFLFDFKHVEPDKFAEYTGGDIRQIIGNLECLSRTARDRVILRVPVIPGFNDDLETLCRIFDRTRGYGIKTVHLLPYHTLGLSKYEQLGREYTLSCRSLMKKEELSQYQAIGEAKGLTVQIGG